MFDDNHIDEFDLQMRSILENGKEEVPARIWNGVADGLDKVAKAKAVSLWLKRAAVTFAAAASIAIGFIIIERPDEKAGSFHQGNLIAVVNESEAEVEISEQKQLAERSIAPQNEMTEQITGPVSYDKASADINPITAKQETTEHKSDEKTPEISEQLWEEETYAPKRRIKTSLVIAGIAGTNSPYGSGKSAPHKSPAIDKIPSSSTVRQTGTQTTYGIPVSAGLGVKVHFTPRWALSAGLNYTLLTSRFDGQYTEVAQGSIISQQSAKVKNQQHYIGIPVNAYYNILNRDYINFYAYAGGTVEKCIYNKYLLQTSPVINHTDKVKGVQFSANVGIGVEFLVGQHVGIYIDPSLRYYFKSNQPKSIRTAQPLMLGFEAGLRFNL